VDVQSPTVRALPRLPALPPDIAEFCHAHNIRQHVETGVDLARQTFSSATEIGFRLSEDPEGEQEKLVISVIVDGTVEQAFADYNRFVERWVGAAPWEVRKLIRLSYDIA
jgi:hypothetical protein